MTEQERREALSRDQHIAASVLARSGATCRDAAASAARSVAVVSGWRSDPAFAALVTAARGRQADAAVGSTAAP